MNNSNNKKQLSNHNSPIDVDEIWANIEPQVHEINIERKRKKRNRGIIIWLTSLAGAVVVGLLLIQYFPTTNTKARLKQIQDAAPNNPSHDDSSSSKLDIAENDTLVEPNISEVTQSQKSNNIFQNTTIPIHKKQNTKSNFKPSEYLSNKIIPSNKLNSQSYSEIHNLHNPKTKPNTIISPVSIAFLPLRTSDWPLKPQPLIDEPQLAGLNLPENLSSEDKKGKISWHLAASTGVGHSMQNFRAKNNDATPLRNFRKQYESTTVSFLSDLKMNAIFANKWILSAGLNYTLINQDLELYLTQTDSTIIYGETSRRTNPNGNTIINSGLITQTTIYNLEKKFYNEIHQINIPILFGYKLTFNNKLSLLLLSGVQINILQKADGKTLEVNGFQNHSFDQIYANRSNVQYTVQPQIQYQINNKLGIQLSTIYTHTPDITQDQYHVSHAFNTLSLNLGAYYKLQ